jgi:hypothetical protein
MNSKSRKNELEKLVKQAEQAALLKKVADEASQQTTDSTAYSDKIFTNLLDSIKIEGLED